MEVHRGPRRAREVLLGTCHPFITNPPISSSAWHQPMLTSPPKTHRTLHSHSRAPTPPCPSRAAAPLPGAPQPTPCATSASIPCHERGRAVPLHQGA